MPTPCHALEAAGTGDLIFTESDMIGRRAVLDIATATSLLPQVVEKDDVLGWLLAGIYRL